MPDPLTPETRAAAIEAIKRAMDENSRACGAMGRAHNQVDDLEIALLKQVELGTPEGDAAARDTFEQLLDYALDTLGHEATKPLEPIARLIGRTPSPVDDAPESPDSDDRPALHRLADATCAKVRDWLFRSAPLIARILETEGTTETAELRITLTLGEGDAYEASFREEMGLGDVRVELDP